MFCFARARYSLKAAALAAGTLLAVSASVSTAFAVTASSPRRSGSLVAHAGPGWAMAEYSRSTRTHASATTLYAVSPQGRRYAVYTWRPPRYRRSSYSLVDWSGDGQRVLAVNGWNRFEQIDVLTGKVINSFRLPASVTVLGYTRPHGENILAYSGTRLVRYNLRGKLRKVLARPVRSGAIEAPDGRTVIAGTRYGIEQISNLGGVVKRLRAPVRVGACEPVRWWTATTVLAYCGAAHGPSFPRLWLFPVSGRRVRALTAQRSHSADLGDIDAWHLSSGVYLQALGACGTEFIAKQWHNGSAHEVPVPGYDNVHIVTGHRSRLLVQAQDPCGIGRSLLWFNPATRSVRYVFRTPDKVEGVVAVVPFGRPLS